MTQCDSDSDCRNLAPYIKFAQIMGQVKPSNNAQEMLAKLQFNLKSIFIDFYSFSIATAFRSFFHYLYTHTSVARLSMTFLRDNVTISWSLSCLFPLKVINEIYNTWGVWDGIRVRCWWLQGWPCRHTYIWKSAHKSNKLIAWIDFGLHS